MENQYPPSSLCVNQFPVVDQGKMMTFVAKAHGLDYLPASVKRCDSSSDCGGLVKQLPKNAKKMKCYYPSTLGFNTFQQAVAKQHPYLPEKLVEKLRECYQTPQAHHCLSTKLDSCAPDMAQLHPVCISKLFIEPMDISQ